MAKRMISARLSDASHDKLSWLSDRYGTQTSALEVAIDRLYNSERRATMYTDNELYELFVAPETGPQEILSLSEERIADQVHDLILDAEAWDDDPRHNSEDPRLPRTTEGEVDYTAIAQAIRRAARH